jgi:hypothetical protein
MCLKVRCSATRTAFGSTRSSSTRRRPGHLWADRFDKPLTDLFALQDEIVASLASQLGAELVTDEARRAEHASNPDSMDLYFQGRASINKGANPENNALARDFYERALALDPRNLDASLGKTGVDSSTAG